MSVKMSEALNVKPQGIEGAAAAKEIFMDESAQAVVSLQNICEWKAQTKVLPIAVTVRRADAGVSGK